MAVSPNGGLVLGADWTGTSMSRFAVQRPLAYAPVTEDWTLSVDNVSGSLRCFGVAASRRTAGDSVLAPQLFRSA